MKEFALYTLARLSLLVLACALVAGVWRIFDSPVPVLGVLVVGALVSMVASVYLLNGLRARFTQRVHERATRMSQRFEEIRSAEDVD